MPKRAPTPCRHPGCPELVDRGFCEVHRKAEARRLDEHRPSASRRGYDHIWRTVVRPAQLRRYPLCCVCESEGVLTPADVVDHIDGDTRNNAPDNLRSMCKRHHDQRTARDQAFGRGIDKSNA